MNKSQQQIAERWRKVQQRRMFAAVRKQDGVFGKPFAKTVATSEVKNEKAN